MCNRNGQTQIKLTGGGQKKKERGMNGNKIKEMDRTMDRRKMDGWIDGWRER